MKAEALQNPSQPPRVRGLDPVGSLTSPSEGHPLGLNIPGNVCFFDGRRGSSYVMPDDGNWNVPWEDVNAQILKERIDKLAEGGRANDPQILELMGMEVPRMSNFRRERNHPVLSGHSRYIVDCVIVPGKGKHKRKIWGWRYDGSVNRY